MGYFHSYVEKHRASGELILQPRMGFSEVGKMREGLCAMRDLPGLRIGTLTIDSMTRQGLFDEARRALDQRRDLNGFPIVAHGAEATRKMLDGVIGADFPVQIRHGTPMPRLIFETAYQVGLDAIEGGPVSYCLPYGRTPLRESVGSWRDSVCFWAEAGANSGRIFHVESFAGCMMGQLCPPSIRVALSILEGLFFAGCGLMSASFSFAQGANRDQDVGAILALKSLADEYLPAHLRWHIVVYTWMGLFPETSAGARRLITESVAIAVIAQAQRLIVKTDVEAFHIPTIADNALAMKCARAANTAAQEIRISSAAHEHRETIYQEAKVILEAALSIDSSIDRVLLRGFETGILDVPYCFHPDNRNLARATIDPDSGVIEWTAAGRLPVSVRSRPHSTCAAGSENILASLEFNRRRYDQSAYEQKNSSALESTFR